MSANRCRDVSVCSVVMTIVLGLCLAMFAETVRSEELVVLRNGLSRTGTIFDFPSMNKNAFAAANNNGKAMPIIMVDDGMRRTYMYRRGMVLGDPKPVRGVEKTIEFGFKPPVNGQVVNGVGALLGVSPFNEFGRRAVSIAGPKGEALAILQGITELNSRYARVQALKDRPSYVWDMRVATSSLDSATLQSIFKRRLMRPGLSEDQQIDMRLQHVRFFWEGKRYADARSVLKQLIKDFPQLDMDAQLIQITEDEAARLIDEATQRAEIGQESFARKVLSTFRPQAVSRLTREKVAQVVADFDEIQKSIDDANAKLVSQIVQLTQPKQKALVGIQNEIQAGLSRATLPRLSDYLLQADSNTMPIESRVSLGISGWLLGKGNGIQNLTVTTSLIQVRDLVREYLGTVDAGRRKAILEQLGNLEGAEPEYISKMLPNLLPPKELPGEAADPVITGMYRFGMGESQPNTLQGSAVTPRYEIQLPPDYDPLREYPCIVALHPPRGVPSQQLDWWSGLFNPGLGFRSGHATRHGYIVVAPAWTRPGQGVYEYTPREHQRVLIALRDAMRRTSIDSDRVFLVGHGDGATAAWDIAVSHPDLWAGMIAISSDPGKTITHYSRNAELVPIYTVNGELDGVKSKNNHAFTGILDDYVNVRADAMVVDYRGWGFSDFYDEIHNLFDWMNVSSHTRKAIPRDLDLVTMREGDDFFWWLELDGLKEGAAVNPVLWEQAKRIRGLKVEASVGASNNIRISQGPSERFTVWLRPGMGVDLSQQVVVRYGTRPVRYDFDGDIVTMLEDARQRADRKRPFWAKVSVP